MDKWIKTTDELPKPPQHILVTIEDSSGTPMVLPSIVTDEDRIQIEEGQVMRTIGFSVVKAWMPFPEPFQERQHELADTKVRKQT